MKNEHREKYEELNRRFGVAWNKESPKFVNETLISLVQKYVEDEYFNNIRLGLWDGLAVAFAAYNDRSGLSLAEMVCMQKQAARTLVHKTYFIVKVNSDAITEIVEVLLEEEILESEQAPEIKPYHFLLRGVDYFKNK